MEERNDMQPIWWRRILLLAVLCIVVMLLASLTLRINRRMSQLEHGGEAALRPWMNVPYIARIYKVPSDVLYQAVGINPETHDRRPLARIAREQDVPVELVLEMTQTAINSWRSGPLPPLAPVPPHPPIREVTPVPPSTPLPPRPLIPEATPIAPMPSPSLRQVQPCR